MTITLHDRQKEVAGFNLTPRLYELLAYAAKTVGYDPDDAMPLIIDELTAHEYRVLHEFLSWVSKTPCDCFLSKAPYMHSSDKVHMQHFGDGNYKKVFAEFAKTV